MPLALKCAREGATWPLAAVTELRENTLLEHDSNITISPR